MGPECRRKELRRLCEAFVAHALRLPKWDSFEHVKDLSEFQALYALAETEGLVSKIGVMKSGAGGEPLSPDARDLWRFYLLPLLTRSTERNFGEVYPSWEESLYADSAIWHVVAPLPRFGARCEAVELPNGVAIRELTAGEKQYLQRFTEEIALAHELGLPDADFGMCCRKPLPKGGPMEHTLGHEEFDVAVTALKLLKRGAVWYNVTVQTVEQPPFGTQFPVGAPSSGWESKPRAYGGKYELLEEDAELLVLLVGGLSKIGEAERLRLALARFELAYERTQPEDRLIDHWVALEALFLPGISDELSFRASLRIAYYLTSSPDERQDIFDKMRLSYKTRSKVVHGELPKADVHQVASDTEEILRRALRAEVTNPGSLNVDRLDAAIARGGSPEQERTLE